MGLPVSVNLPYSTCRNFRYMDMTRALILVRGINVATLSSGGHMKKVEDSYP